MFKRRTKIVGLVLAVAGAVLPALATAAPANATVSDFLFNIRMIDNAGRSGQGTTQFTPLLSSGGGLSGWAYDDNFVDPDGAQLGLGSNGIPTNLDFRICGQAIDKKGRLGADIGPLVCSPWASQGGGATPPVTDNNQFDPDGYRVALQVQPLPPGVDVLDLRLFIAAFDNGVSGPTQFTPWLSQGPGTSPYAFDQNKFDPDGFIFGISVRLS